MKLLKDLLEFWDELSQKNVLQHFFLLNKISSQK